MSSLESPHRGDSNENTQYTIFKVKTKITLNYPKFAAMGFCSKAFKDEFETAVVNEPSVFEPLKFYCKYWYAFANASSYERKETRSKCTLRVKYIAYFPERTMNPINKRVQ